MHYNLEHLDYSGTATWVYNEVGRVTATLTYVHKTILVEFLLLQNKEELAHLTCENGRVNHCVIQYSCAGQAV